MTHRPTRDRPLPVFSVLLASSWAPPTASDWDKAGTVAASDYMDAVYQLTCHVGTPVDAWVKGDGKVRLVRAETQATSGVGR